MPEFDLLRALPKTKRNIAKRRDGKDPSVVATAKQFGEMYFDGPREYGYGGYRYDGRWVPVARDIVRRFDLKPGMRDLVSTRDLSPSEVRSILDLAAVVKARPSDFRRTLEGKQLVMFFEKPSLRTRLTFEAGMASLGGTAFFMDQTGGRIDARESLWDIAHNVSRWVDAIVLRTFSQSQERDAGLRGRWQQRGALAAAYRRDVGIARAGGDARRVRTEG